MKPYERAEDCFKALMNSLTSSIEAILQERLEERDNYERYGVEFQLGDANFTNFDPFDYVPEKEILFLEKRYQGISLSRPGRAVELEKVFHNLLAEETTLDLRDRNPLVIQGSTRLAIGHLFDSLAKDDKSIAIPIPNWWFWHVESPTKRNYQFTYFDGKDQANFADNLERIVKRERVGAVVLSDPSTPLGYEFKEETVRAVDRIAQKEGIAVIIDDVLRGTKPIGSRDTIARWVSEPFIAEGLSHRLGLNAGAISYILPPQKNKTKLSDYKFTPNDDKLKARLIKTALKYGTNPALYELEARNVEFEKGFKENAPESVKLTRPYASSISSLIELPEDYPLDGEQFAEMATKMGGVETAPMSCFYPEGYEIPQDLSRKIRISIGHSSRRGVRRAGEILGYGLLERSRQL